MANLGLLSDPIFLLIAIVLADVPAHASSEQPAVKDPEGLAGGLIRRTSMTICLS